MTSGLPGQTSHAFLSYSREDSEFAQRLAKDLKAFGASLWLDLDIIPAHRWDDAIEKAIHNCSRMLVVLSPAAVASTNVMDEVGLALDKRKTVIPVLHRECEIPLRLRRVQYVDFLGDYNTAVRKLLKTLGVEDPESKVERERQEREAEGFHQAEEERREGEAAETARKAEKERRKGESAGAARIAEQERHEREAVEVAQNNPRGKYWIAGSITALIIVVIGLALSNWHSAQNAIPGTNSPSKIKDPDAPVSPENPVAVLEQLPFFMVRLCTEADVAGKTVEDVRVMRNEIYARHGRRFQNARLQQHFERQSWYLPMYAPNAFPLNLLTPVQRRNTEFLQQIESRLKK